MATLAKRSVLITGCSPGGIGHALALEYHSKGLLVFATARKVEVLADLAELGISTIALDVTDVESIRRARDHVSEVTGGTLDVLVNNAGQQYLSPSAEVDMSRARTLFETNLFGVMTMVTEFLSLVVAAQGQIFNIGSAVVYLPATFGGVYTAAKAALHSYGDALRVELEPFNVNVTTIITGSISTNMNLADASGVESPIKSGSLYEPMHALYLKKRNELQSDVSKKTSAEVYAQRLVARTLGRSPGGRLSIGSASSLLWFIDTFFPKSALTYVAGLMYGLNQLNTLIRLGKTQSAPL